MKPAAKGVPATGFGALTPVGTDTLSDRVYERLSCAVMTGEFEPGASITLREAAHHAGTSVMPVREALGRLMAQGAVILERNKAIRIPLLSSSEFEQLWKLRGQLEGEACAQAAPLISREELTDIAELLEQTLTAADTRDMRLIILKAREFFFRIYRAARNSALDTMISMAWLRSGPLYFEAVSSVSHLSFIRKSLRNNERLLEALRAGDAVAARDTRAADLVELATWLRILRANGAAAAGAT